MSNTHTNTASHTHTPLREVPKHLRRLNPSQFHEQISARALEAADPLANPYEAYNKFYDERAVHKDKRRNDSACSTASAASAESTASTAQNWSETIRDYWMHDTRIEDIEFDDSSDEE
ncbi:hypothetical protein DAKH74_022550 [Maudiozyma humilis]|uniref:Uncharacterized protein n=1 Tax=Maudiozyma humilis TaxID=51915 RepID=A0AAV5RYU8_MAUHU|nr:hypothetical protein DAKH74_022550 [Kazachstania humilis]